MHVGVFLSQEVELPHDADLPHACGGASYDFIILRALKPSSLHACRGDPRPSSSATPVPVGTVRR